MRHTRVKIEVLPLRGCSLRFAWVLRDRDRGAQDDKKQGLRTTEGCHPETGGMAEGSGVSFWTSILLSLNAEVLKHPVWTHFKSQPGSSPSGDAARSLPLRMTEKGTPCCGMLPPLRLGAARSRSGEKHTVRTTGKGTKPRFFVAALLRMTKLRPRPRARGHTERKPLRSIPGGERPWICRPERSEGPEFRSSESKPRSFRRKARRQDDKQGANPFARDDK